MSVPARQGYTKTVFCRHRKRAVEIPAPGAPEDQSGHPYGWFYLTVHVPPWFNQDIRRAYRPVGTFCSAACLAAEMPAIEEQERLMEGVYEHE
jgi:hypothetical protein